MSFDVDQIHLLKINHFYLLKLLASVKTFLFINGISFNFAARYGLGKTIYNLAPINTIKWQIKQQ
jgi:hypothetical protein